MHLVEHEPKARVEPLTQKSNHKGLAGFFENIFRRFHVLLTVILLIPIYIIGTLCLGLALTPGVTLFHWGMPHLQAHGLPYQILGISLMLAISYIFFGFSLIIIIPICNFILRTYPKPWRGLYYSLPTIRWGVHNALTYIPRYIFLEYMTPTPFNILFYKLMGMKIGKGAQVNTTNISDPCLIEIGERATIGGSATIIAHYAQGGYLIIAPVKIGNGATIGLRATIMGGVTIGDKAKILPNSLVLPKTHVPAGETWGGVPAHKIQSLYKR